MSYRSGFASDLEDFVWYRKASGTWNEYASNENLRYFDRYCADNYEDSSALTQEMVDTWCRQRDTETAKSCITRTLIVRRFIEYMRARERSTVTIPAMPKPEGNRYIPHAFTQEELTAFFAECDNIIPYKNRPASILRKIQMPALYRLLFSSGIRTTEARYLKRNEVDLDHGVLNIHKSKGSDQHYVALHDTMTEILLQYDVASDKLQPDRKYFFESIKGTCYSRNWVSRNFQILWKSAHNSAEDAIPYDLRHNYAIENIASWEDDSFTFSDKLHYLSKSMGHRHLVSTLYYYSITPRLADKLLNKTESGFNEIVPEVWDEEN